MKKIIHLSDLHFGTERPGILPLLLADVLATQPDLIIISGDLTQRATHAQYADMKKFIESLRPYPVLCVPGNHDISLFNLIERFFYPYDKYKKWISPTLCVHKKVDSLAILGINSVTPYKPSGGYITKKQLAFIKDYFKAQPDDAIRVVVMHHNLISSRRHKIINDSEKLINLLADLKVNLVLSGHIHFACIEMLDRPYLKHKLYVITAGTAISTRTAEPNSYNVLVFDQDHFKLSVRAYEPSHFYTRNEDVFPL